VTLFDLIRSSANIMKCTQGNPFKDLGAYQKELENNAVNVARMPVISFFSELAQSLDTSKTKLHCTMGQLIANKTLTRPLWGFVSNLPAYLYPSISFDINDLYYPKNEQIPFDMIAVPFFDSRRPDKAVRFLCEASLAQFDDRDLTACRFDKPVHILKSLLKNTSLAIHHADDPAWQQFEKEECSHKQAARNVVHFFLTKFDGYTTSDIPVCGGTKPLNSKQVDYMIVGDAWLTPWFRFGVGVSDGWYGVEMLVKALSFNKRFSDPECAKVLKCFETDMRHRALEYVAMIYCIRSQICSL
jgi:hypothetical protein